MEEEQFTLRSTTPQQVMGVVLIVVVLSVVLNAQPTVGQYYCNGRAAVTLQWGGCNGTEAVCSDLMQAITQTYNWWNGTNNTAGNSLGVAVHNFFTTDAYGALLSITNNNTAYPTACKKISAVVAQLLTWNASKDANVVLGNATYAATVRQELFNTVIPGWGYTIGDYIACGSTCTNFTSTTSTTTTRTSTSTTTRTTTLTTTPPTSSTTSTTATSAGCTPPVNTSGVAYINPTLAEYPFEIVEIPSGSCSCSSPYAQMLFMPGLDTPQSSQSITKPYSQFKPNSAPSVEMACNPGDQAGSALTSQCLCSPNGSCYSTVNLSGNQINAYFTSWCGGGSCLSYLTYCYTRGYPYVNAITGQPAFDCDAIGAAANVPGSLGACPGPNCSFPVIDYVLCGNCSANGVKPAVDCGPFSAACEGAPETSSSCHIVITEPGNGSGQNFPTFDQSELSGTCGGCNSIDETDYYFADFSEPNFYCWNGVNTSQPDWTGLCLCTVDGNCYQWEVAPGTNTSINAAVKSMQFQIDYNEYACYNYVYIYCASGLGSNTNVQLVDVYGNVVGACQQNTYNIILYAIASIRCNGGCPSDGPLDEFCPGPYVAS